MHNISKIFLGLLFCFIAQADQPITLFCHGIVDNQKQSQRFHEVLMQPVQLFDFHDAQKPQAWDLNNLIFQSCFLFGKFVNRNNMFMGHGQDVILLAQQVDQAKQYILYGVSRGGAAAINYIAEYNPSNIQALILDATPADMISPIDTLQYVVGYKFAPNRMVQENIFRAVFPGYQIGSIPPVKNIAQIKNKNLPIFIVHSNEDSRVSISSAWQLYRAFQQHGFEHVYLCQLQHGKHSFCLQGPDKDVYLHALHSFYKKYGFACNEQYADFDLAQLQPTIEQVYERLYEFEQNLEKLYKTRKLQLQVSLGTILVVAGLGSALYLKDSFDLYIQKS